MKAEIQLVTQTSGPASWSKSSIYWPNHVLKVRRWTTAASMFKYSLIFLRLFLFVLDSKSFPMYLYITIEKDTYPASSGAAYNTDIQASHVGMTCCSNQKVPNVNLTFHVCEDTCPHLRNVTNGQRNWICTQRKVFTPFKHLLSSASPITWISHETSVAFASSTFYSTISGMDSALPRLSPFFKKSQQAPSSLFMAKTVRNLKILNCNSYTTM